MAAPPPPPYGPPRPFVSQSPAVIIAVVIAVAFVAGFLFLFAVGFGAGGFSAFVLAPFCLVFVFILIAIVWAVTQGGMSNRIPPPPPIQQPMVPAGQVGPVALNCPNCGAPPQNVDRFGVATCTYCNTRFLVR